MECRSILIVEEDLELRESLLTALEDEGYHVLQTSSGKEAIDLLSRLGPGERPGCIIVDLPMPVKDQEKFLHVIHTDRLQYSKLLDLLSSAGSIDEFKLAVEKLRRPIDLERLLKMVSRHCGSPP